MFDYETVKQQVTDYITNGAAEVEDYDVDGIMDLLRDMDVASIDDVDMGTILAAYDVCADGFDSLFCDTDGQCDLYYNPDKGDWYIRIDDPASSDICIGCGEAARTDAIYAGLRLLAEFTR